MRGAPVGGDAGIECSANWLGICRCDRCACQLRLARPSASALPECGALPHPVGAAASVVLVGAVFRILQEFAGLSVDSDLVRHALKSDVEGIAQPATALLLF